VPRPHDPDLLKYSTPGEDLKWTAAFFATFAIPIAALLLILAGLIALL
jgi:hypothetical protein